MCIVQYASAKKFKNERSQLGAGFSNVTKVP